MKKLIIAAFLVSAVATTHAATVNWGAGTDNGFDVPGGADLGQSNWARVGYFDVSDSLLAANAFDLTFLNSHFTEFASAQIGAGFDIDGHFSVASNNNPAATGGVVPNIVAAQVYYWVFSSTSRGNVGLALTTATAQGIFYMNKANNSAWAFPSQTPVPGATTTDLTDLTDSGGNNLVTGATIVVGSFGPGVSAATGATNFTLAAVPEPTSALLLAIGTAGLMIRRRRQS